MRRKSPPFFLRDIGLEGKLMSNSNSDMLRGTLLENLINPHLVDSLGVSAPDTALITKRNWSCSDGSYWAIGDTCTSIPKGLFAIDYSQQTGFFFKELKNDLDTIIDLPDSESEKLIKEISEFTTMKESFKTHGFLYKRGILLWGPPGSGKTVTIQQLIRLFTQTIDGIAVMCGDPSLLLGGLRDFRKIEPERQVLVIIEDIDSMIDIHGESDFLGMLDGEAQLQNVVYVATTNYPERLDNRFKDRPSRFDTIRKIDMPTEIARRKYLEVKLPDVDAETLEYYVANSKDFSIAYLREIIVLTECFGLSREDAFERLNFMRKNLPDSTKINGRGNFGFTKGD